MERAPGASWPPFSASRLGTRQRRRTPWYDSGHDSWGPELCAGRPDLTMEIVDQYLHNLYRIQPDFAYSVSRDFARSCQTPMLVMPDDTPSHSLEAAMDLAALAPKAQVTEYPWKEAEDIKAKDHQPGARLPSGASTCEYRAIKGSTENRRPVGQAPVIPHSP